MPAPRLQISPGYSRLMNYPRFAGPTRLLILETRYFFDHGWQRAAERLGWAVASVPSAMAGHLERAAIEQLFATMATFRPDFILTSNYGGMDQMGLFARFFEDVRVPYVSWFTDSPRMILYGRTVHASEFAVAATWERAYRPHFEALGFKHVIDLPLAADDTLFNAPAHQAPPRQLAFVGHSMACHAEAAFGKLRDNSEVTAALEAAFAESRVTREAFAAGVETILGEALVQRLNPRDRRHTELALVYEATRRARRALAERMVPYGIEVRGDAGWQGIAPSCGGNVGYFDDLPRYYRDTAINLNTTSLQMASAVNQRVFDAPAAGGFLITDAQSDLEHLFDCDREVVRYRSLDELEEQVQRYRTDTDTRRRVVEAASRRVLSQHTLRHRLQTLEAYLRPRFGG